MTLALALRGSDGLVLASDSRVSSETGTADTSVKFLQINREIGIMTYGLADPGYRTIMRLYNEVNKVNKFTPETKRMVYMSEIVKLTQKIAKQEYEKWVETYRTKNEGREPVGYILGFILAGFDSNETNQFKIWLCQTPDLIMQERTDIVAAQYFVSQILLNTLYYPEMNVEQLKSFAVFCLLETETATQGVGGPLQIATVTLEHGFQRLNEREVEKLISENQSRFSRYRRTLLEVFDKYGTA